MTRRVPRNTERNSVEGEVAVYLIQVPGFVLYTRPSPTGKDMLNTEDFIWIRTHE